MRGVKAKWKKSHIETARKAARDGETIPMIAAKLRVKPTKFYAWMLEHEELRAVVQEGRDYFDSVVAENKLLKLIKGSTSTEKTVTEELDEDGNVVGRKVTTKRVKNLPLFNAIKWYQQNRHQDRWKEKYEVEVRGGDTLEEKLRAAKERELKKDGDNSREESRRGTSGED